MITIGKNAVQITEECKQDQDDIREVIIAAFGSIGEAEVVDQLRRTCPVFISLVAKVDNKIVGHVLFTPVRLVFMEDQIIVGIGLAPLAVLPEYQNQGVGTELCSEGLSRVTLAGYPYVVVLGDPSYYHRFGFQQACDFGIKSAFTDVPEDAFMIKILKPDIMDRIKGVIYYQEEFNSVT